MQPESGVKPWQWIVTVIVIIVLIIIGIMVFGDKDGSDTNGTDTPIVDTSNNPLEVNRIVMSDQFPGNVVYISSVTLANGGIVVIHRDNAGAPGAVLGSAYFEKGTSPGRITLTSPTVDGGIYYAVLYADTNTDRSYTASTDTTIKDARGNVIMKLFRASTLVETGIKG